MNLVTAKNLYHSFGDQPLLDHTSLSIETGERICLLGRNGVGKSTLLKMISGQLKPDDGEFNFARDIRIAELKQDIGELEKQNSAYQEQVLKAYQKIKTDEATVARAKKAMAIAADICIYSNHNVSIEAL